MLTVCSLLLLDVHLTIVNKVIRRRDEEIYASSFQCDDKIKILVLLKNNAELEEIFAPEFM